MSNERSFSFTKLNCFLIGAGIGATIALLFAPKSGKELRGDISDTAQRSAEYANTGIKQVKEGAAQIYTAGLEKASDLISAGKDLIQEQKEIVATALDAGKKAYLDNKATIAKAAPEA